LQFIAGKRRRIRYIYYQRGQVAIGTKIKNVGLTSSGFARVGDANARAQIEQRTLNVLKTTACQKKNRKKLGENFIFKKTRPVI